MRRRPCPCGQRSSRSLAALSTDHSEDGESLPARGCSALSHASLQGRKNGGFDRASLPEEHLSEYRSRGLDGRLDGAR